MPALAGLALAGPLGTFLGFGDSEAKKRKKKKKKCKKSQRKCGKKCIPATRCCSADDCGFQGACEGGVCDCKSGARFCQGTCIPEDDCCTDEECRADQTCQDGQCDCPTGQRECDGACIPTADCCTSDDCDDCETCVDGTCVANACCPACPSGQECLSNGSCATTCVENEDCPGCIGGCSLLSTEAEKHCSGLDTCEGITQECISTAECPTGQQCQLTICGPGGMFQNRCFPLCNP